MIASKSQHSFAAPFGLNNNNNNNVPRSLDTVQRRSADDCAICMTKPAVYGILSHCTHAFCHSCITSWRRQSQACPTCRLYSPHVVVSAVFVVREKKKTLFQINGIAI
jgi:hypothetical protein